MKWLQFCAEDQDIVVNSAEIRWIYSREDVLRIGFLHQKSGEYEEWVHSHSVRWVDTPDIAMENTLDHIAGVR